MTLDDLIGIVRTDAKDDTEPYFWSDEQITGWLNEAAAEAALRGRLIHESADSTVCDIPVTAGTAVHDLHPSLYELDYVSFTETGADAPCRLPILSREKLDTLAPDWRQETGTPRYALQDDTRIRLSPTPDADGTLRVEGYRTPLAPMALANRATDTPELKPIHHVHLSHFALYRGFSIPDMEMFDQERADRALGAFTNYFGLRPDSDLRRITREDTPHHVEAFWI